VTDTQAEINALLAEYGEPDVELEEWELPWFDTRVALEDGRRFKVHADQRDQRRALEVLGIESPQVSNAIAYATAVSWAYLTRKGQVSDTWAAFDAGCAFVQMQEVKTVDPTGTAGEL
jgi:hypothetical protein